MFMENWFPSFYKNKLFCKGIMFIQISEDLTYEEVPVQIVDVIDKVLRHAVIKL